MNHSHRLHGIWMRNSLAALHHGELTGRKRAAVERHLSACTQCRRTIQEFRTLDAALKSARPNATSLAPEQAQAILASALAELERPSRRPVRTLAVAGLAGALGAALLFWTALKPKPVVLVQTPTQARQDSGPQRIPPVVEHRRKAADVVAVNTTRRGRRTRPTANNKVDHRIRIALVPDSLLRRRIVHGTMQVRAEASSASASVPAFRAKSSAAVDDVVTPARPKGHLVVIASGVAPRIPVTLTAEGPTGFGFARVTSYPVNDQGVVVRNQCTVREGGDTNTTSTLQRDAVSGRRVSSLTVEAAGTKGEPGSPPLQKEHLDEN